MRDFEKLKVWQRAHRLVLSVYQVTASFPREERWNLVDQMRRSGTSIAGNIAEGAGLGSDAQLARHLVIASGSSSELEYLALLSRDLGHLSATAHRDLRQDIRATRRQIWAFLRHLRTP